MLSQPSYIVNLYPPENGKSTPKQVREFIQMVEQLPDTRIITHYDLDVLQEKKYLGEIFVIYHAFPKSFGEFSRQDYTAEKITDGSTEFKSLDSVIFHKETYDVLKHIGQIKDETIDLYLPDRYGVWKLRPRKIQSTIEDSEFTAKNTINGDQLGGYIHVFLPLEVFDTNYLMNNSNYRYTIYSPYAESILKLAREAKFGGHSPAFEKAEARATMRQNIQLKGWVSFLTFLLLALNLNGSFANALKDRRYEIALKRALGGTPLRITQEFLLEALLVMGAGILLSLLIIVNAMSLYRLYLYINTKEVLIVRLTPESILTLLTMCASLTVASGLSFSANAMKTNIVSALQGAGEEAKADSSAPR